MTVGEIQPSFFIPPQYGVENGVFKNNFCCSTPLGGGIIVSKLMRIAANLCIQHIAYDIVHQIRSVLHNKTSENIEKRPPPYGAVNLPQYLLQ